MLRVRYSCLKAAISMFVLSAVRMSAALCTCGQHGRVANIRKHQLLKPEVKVMVTAIDSITPSNYVFEYLAIEAQEMQQMNLELGFPAHAVHIIKPTSPLFNLSLQVSPVACALNPA